MATYQTGQNRIVFESEGVQLVGNLYLPPAFDPAQTYPGLIVTGSWTTVKEQMAGLYAERLAQEGFVTLAFDFRFYGESGGEPRQYEDPEAKCIDIQHAVSFVGALPFVATERIGGLGVCASSGYLAAAAAADSRIRALALVAPWLHNAELVAAIYGGAEGVQQRIAAGETARQQYAASGAVAYIAGASATDQSAAMYAPEAAWLGYYLTPGRVSPHWDNRLAVMSWKPWLTFDAIQVAPQLRVPVLLVGSDALAVPDGARQFYAALTAPKELVWTEGTQLDFYDQQPQVRTAVNAAVTHFRQTL